VSREVVLQSATATVKFGAIECRFDERRLHYKIGACLGMIHPYVSGKSITWLAYLFITGSHFGASRATAQEAADELFTKIQGVRNELKEALGL
jgi:hypothetical protein